MSNKRLLIVTGPQGSGNHVFSRLFSLHPEVGGWEALHDEYWVPSDLEPFADYWVNPERLDEFDFSSSDYWVANVSCPFFFDGVRYTPKIIEFAEKCRDLDIEVVIAIIVRDQNINSAQQMRVRKEITLPIAQDYYYTHLLPSNFDVHFLDHEAFFLHREHYLKYCERILNFPVAWDDKKIMNFIDKDANSKYTNYIDEYWLDQHVWRGCQSKSQRGIK